MSEYCSPPELKRVRRQQQVAQCRPLLNNVRTSGLSLPASSALLAAVPSYKQTTFIKPSVEIRTCDLAEVEQVGLKTITVRVNRSVAARNRAVR